MNIEQGIMMRIRKRNYSVSRTKLPEFNQNQFSHKGARRRKDEQWMKIRSKSIVDCCYRIHINLGPGLLESDISKFSYMN